MSTEIPLLDHGYIRLVEVWGSDERIIESARMSTNKGFQGWGPKIVQVPSRLPSGGVTVEEQPGDEKLLRYLWENKHSTPFEMAGAVIEVQAPIFVFREWHRHRTQGYSELSARYTPLPDTNYIPSIERLMQQASKSKQSGKVAGSEELTAENAERFRRRLSVLYDEMQALYEQALTAGVPKELARIHLPVARYSRMRATANLRNWFHFLSLRLPPNAQYEIRVYAKALIGILSEHFPRSCGLFREGMK
jgi:thymidylate synthase (FAD)